MSPTPPPPPLDFTARFICCEEIDGTRWRYLMDDSSGKFRKDSFRELHLLVFLVCREAHIARLLLKLGTGLSIMISKRNPSLVGIFALLSCGYLFRSYQEVRHVVLHSLNRARFSVAVESFQKTGRVPCLLEGNMKEEIFSLLWLKERPIVLERYLITYNPSKGKVYALLKDKVKPDDVVKTAFHAHVLLHFLSLLSNG